MENSEPIAALPANEYVINSVQQLFPLNQNLVNFRASFVVRSASGEPFLGLVVDQHALDSGENLSFRAAEQGVFSGEISQDNGESTNWYLVLKSAKPNKVSVDIRTQPIAAHSLAPVQPPAPVQPLPAAARMQAARRSSSRTSLGGLWEQFNALHPALKLILGAGLASGLYWLWQKWQERRGHGRAAQDDEGLDHLSNQEVAAVLAPAAKPAGVEPLAAAAPAAAPAAPVIDPIASVEGATTATVLGDDLLAKVNKLPDI
jgi:hypothetical protein